MEVTVIPASPPFQKYPHDGIAGALSLAYRGEDIFMSLEPFTLTRGENQRDFREGDFFCKGSIDIRGSFQGEIKDIKTLKVIPPRIGLYVGGAASYLMYYPFLAFFERFGLDYTLFHDRSFSQSNLSRCNVIIIPGGGTYWDNLTDLFGGEEGRRALIEFVEQGGGYIGTCFGSYVAMGSPPAHMRGSFDLTPSSNRFGREWQHTGAGYVYVRLQDHPVSAGVSKRLEVLHWNGVVWDTESPGMIAAYEEWGMENNLWNSNQLTEETFNRNMKGFPAIIATTFGGGIIILSGPHPEFGLQYKRHLSVLKYFGKEDPRHVITRVETPFLEDPTWRYLFNMVVYAARKEVEPLPSFEIADSEFVLRCSRLVHLIDRIDMDCRSFTGDEKIKYEKSLIYEYSQRIPRILYSLCTKKEILPKTAFIVEKSLPVLQYAYAVQPDEGNTALPVEGFVAAARKSHTAENLAHIALALESILFPLEASQKYPLERL